EAQASEGFPRSALQRIAVELLKARLYLAIARDDVLHLGFLFRIGHRSLEQLQFAGDHADGAGAIHHLSHRAAARHLADILAEIADGYAAVSRDLPFIGLVLA